MSARELFSHQGKCLIFSFVFGNGQGEQERKPCEQQGLLSCVATRGPPQPRESGGGGHVSKVSPPEASQLTHRNTLSGSSRSKLIYQP